MSLRPGTLLVNRYRVEAILGQGGMGAVYRAIDANLGVTVAVKENLFTTEEFARQFVREAGILASLRHSGLPRVTDHFVIEGEGQYLVMDFVAGEDLRERLERSGPVSEEDGLPWFLDICDALAYLHTRVPPILHRDVAGTSSSRRTAGGCWSTSAWRKSSKAPVRPRPAPKR
jgi:serine/threonine protein kinase